MVLWRCCIRVAMRSILAIRVSSLLSVVLAMLGLMGVGVVLLRLRRLCHLLSGVRVLLFLWMVSDLGRLVRLMSRLVNVTLIRLSVVWTCTWL